VVSYLLVEALEITFAPPKPKVREHDDR